MDANGRQWTPMGACALLRIRVYSRSFAVQSERGAKKESEKAGTITIMITITITNAPDGAKKGGRTMKGLFSSGFY